MRCFICDYSSDTKSDFFTGSYSGGPAYRRMIVCDDGTELCQTCFDKSYYDYDDRFDENDMLDAEFDLVYD